MDKELFCLNKIKSNYKYYRCKMCYRALIKLTNEGIRKTLKGHNKNCKIFKRTKSIECYSDVEFLEYDKEVKFREENLLKDLEKNDNQEQLKETLIKTFRFKVHNKISKL